MRPSQCCGRHSGAHAEMLCGCVCAAVRVWGLTLHSRRTLVQVTFGKPEARFKPFGEADECTSVARVASCQAPFQRCRLEAAFGSAQLWMPALRSPKCGFTASATSVEGCPSRLWSC